MNRLKKKIFSFLVLFVFLSSSAIAQEILQEKVMDLDSRVRALEEYVQSLQPTFDKFSKNLISNIDMRLQSATDKVVVLNPLSRKFSKIVTNAGDFLISVEKMEKLENGRRIHVQIGNPASTTYSGVILRFRWGRKWDSSFVKPSYEQWRESLVGAEYSYPGALQPGSWTEVVVDLEPASYKLGHIECEMEIESVNLVK